MLPDEENAAPSGNGELPEKEGSGSDSSATEPVKRRRVRVKIRKKIRIKKKPSAKKMFRKVAERAFWTIIIAGFVTSLIIMIIELDIRDAQVKKQRQKANPTKNR